MEQCGHVCVMGSEEDDETIPVLDGGYEGNYTIAFDPLDGSTNIDVNVSVGTIFSIHRRVSSGKQGTLADLLQKEQAGCGRLYYLRIFHGHGLYYRLRGTWAFTLIPSVGEFFLSHPNITIPAKSLYYSVNEAYSGYWYDGMQKLVEYFKSDGEGRKAYSLRYIGWWLISTAI